MTREAELTGVVRPEVDDRALDRASSEMGSRFDKAAEIAPDIDTRSIRRKLERAVPGGRVAGKVADAVGGRGGGGSGGGGAAAGGGIAGEELLVFQEQQVELLEDIKDEVEKLGVSGPGGGNRGGGGFLGGLLPGGGGGGGSGGGGFLAGLGLGGLSSGLGGLGGITGASAGATGVLSPGFGVRQVPEGESAIKGSRSQRFVDNNLNPRDEGSLLNPFFKAGQQTREFALQVPEWLEGLNLQTPDFLEDISLDTPDFLQDIDVSAPDWLENIDVNAPDFLQNLSIEVPSVLKGGIDINAPDFLQSNRGGQQSGRPTVNQAGDATPTSPSRQQFLGLTDDPLNRLRQRGRDQGQNNGQPSPVQVGQVTVEAGEMGPAIDRGFADLERNVTKQLEQKLTGQVPGP